MTQPPIDYPEGIKARLQRIGNIWAKMQAGSMIAGTRTGVTNKSALLPGGHVAPYRVSHTTGQISHKPPVEMVKE